MLLFGGVFTFQYFAIQKINSLPELKEVKQAKATSQTSGWKTYKNNEYSFEYPGRYNIEKSQFGFVYEVDVKDGKNQLLEVGPMSYIEPYGNFPLFKDYIVAKLESTCMADGQDGNIYCDKPISILEFKNHMV